MDKQRGVWNEWKQVPTLHTPHRRLSMSLRDVLSILCAECSYRQRAEEYSVLCVHEVTVDAYGFRDEEYFKLRQYALHDYRITRNVG